MPYGERQCITLASKLNELRSVGRQSSLAKPIVELTVRGTTTSICFCTNAIAAEHWAAVAVQVEGMICPPVVVKLVLMMRFNPGKLRCTSSKLEKKKSLSFLIGPPKVAPV